MRNKRSFYLALSLVSLFSIQMLCVSCRFDIHRFFFRSPSTDSRSDSLSSVVPPTISSSAGQIEFAIITDLHFGSDKSRAESLLLESLASRQIDFLVLLGDSVDTGEDRYFSDCEEFILRVQSKLPGADVPVYVVLGNHDLYKEGYGRWQRLNFNAAKGASFFRFVTETPSGGSTWRRSWYFLDTASGILGTRQLESLSDAMRGDANPKMVFSHIPVYVDTGTLDLKPFNLSDTRERARLITLFDKRGVDMVFSGHWHAGGFFDYGRFSELCCASFIENDGISSWYFLSLDEAAARLEVEEHQVEGGRHSSSVRTYPLDK